VLRVRFYYGCALVTSLYLFSSILSAVVFAVYIGLGNTLDLSIAFTVLTILDLIKEPLRTLPNFVGSCIEFQVSMSRIQEFIHVDEVNPSMIRRLPQDETPDSIAIRDSANFHWGCQEEKKDAKAKDGKKPKAIEETKSLLDD